MDWETVVEDGPSELGESARYCRLSWLKEIEGCGSQLLLRLRNLYDCWACHGASSHRLFDEWTIVLRSLPSVLAVEEACVPGYLLTFVGERLAWLAQFRWDGRWSWCGTTYLLSTGMSEEADPILIRVPEADVSQPVVLRLKCPHGVLAGTLDGLGADAVDVLGDRGRLEAQLSGARLAGEAWCSELHSVSGPHVYRAYRAAFRVAPTGDGADVGSPCDVAQR